STVIVAGSSGAYFEVADQVVQMDRYVPKEITALAKDAAKEYPKLMLPEEKPARPSFDRMVRSNPGIRSKGRVKLKTLGRDGVMLNHDTIDLRYVEQLVDSEQLTSLGNIVRYLEEKLFDGKRTLGQAIEEMNQRLVAQGLDVLSEGGCVAGNLALPRKQEIYACLNRYRQLRGSGR
ncbi:MAG: P-loop domain-containing protein, partial [[Clostridium] scindens]